MDKHIVEANKKVQVLQSNKQEKIVCAAVRMRFTESELCQEIFQNIMCLDYKDQIIEDVKALYDDVLWDIEEEIQGFMTSRGRFVEPREAQKIAIEAGQYNCPNARIKELELAVEGNWFRVHHNCKTERDVRSFKNYIAQDEKEIAELQGGYLGYELRVEDLY